MKCDNCPALYASSYEYPEPECLAGVPEDGKMATDGGCKYSFARIEKRIARRMKMEEHQYDGIIEWYQEQDEKEERYLSKARETFKYQMRDLEIMHGFQITEFLVDDICIRLSWDYMEAEREHNSGYCERCKWKGDGRKCNRCSRAAWHKDNFEEKEAQE